MTDVKIPAGSFGMHDHFIPGVKAGHYSLRVASGMETPDVVEPFYQEEKQVSFTVTAPRFFLRAADDIRGCFPPHGAAADYDWILPNVVLKKRALPWERSVQTDAQGETEVPWLALVVVTHEEMVEDGATLQTLTKERILHPEPADAEVYAPWRDPSQNASWIRNGTHVIGLRGEEEKQTISVLEMSAALFRRLCPKPSELPLLAHVRQVDVSEKQDDDTGKNGDFAILLANRLAQPGTNVVFLVSLEGWQPWLENDQYAPDKPRVRVLVLHSWNFHNTTGDGSFRQSVKNLRVHMLADERTNAALTDASLQEVLSQGYTPIAYQPEGATRTFAWYRGPFSPVRVPLFKDGSIVFDMADEALIIDTDTGIPNVSYSSAWQLGRLLAVTSASYGRALLHWNYAQQAAALNGSRKSVAEEMTDYLRHHASRETQTTELVENIKVVTEWLGTLMLLQRIPFRYLVPSGTLLPPESLRFFYVDDNWLDALIEGALSIGASSLSGDVFERSTRSSIRVAIRQMMVLQAQARRNKPADALDTGAPLCGFLLRSSILSRFPGLEIELVGMDGKAKPNVLRMEILGHELMLVLVLGQDLQQVIFKLPREALAYRADQGRLGPRVTDPQAADFGKRRADGATYAVEMRAGGGAGVVDIVALAKKLEGTESRSGAKFALHWLNGPDDVQITWRHAHEDSAVKS